MGKTSQRVEQDELRARMRAVGMSHNEIAVEFARRYKLRPRAAHRVAHGWTLQQAANHINAHAAHTGLDPDGTATRTAPWLSELENWPVPLRRRPTPQLLALLAEVYGTSIHNLLDLDDREQLPPADLLLLNNTRMSRGGGGPEERIALPAVPAARVTTLVGPPRETMHEIIDRREFVTATAAALTFRGTAPRHVDPALIDYFSQQLEGHYRADMMLGPRELIDTVTAQHALISNVTASARAETRQGLLRASAAYASLIGWLHQDAGDLPASSTWRGIALEAAHRSQDHQLVAYALLNQASVRVDLGDGLGVLDLCGAVLADASRLSPKVRVLALQQRAHGASLLGDRATVDSVLDQAAPLIENCDDSLPWGNAYRRTPAYLEVQRATCYGRLGLGEAAAGLWDQALATTPANARRDRGVYLARQATACVQSGDPGRAVDAGRLAADLALETGSLRIRRELAGLRRAARPWNDTAVGRDLDEILAPVKET